LEPSTAGADAPQTTVHNLRLPPLGNTGVNNSAEVSWWSGTSRVEDPAAVGKKLYSDHLRDWFATAPSPGWTATEDMHYRAGYRLDDWGASVRWDGSGDAAGTVAVEIRQESLALLPQGVLDSLVLMFRTGRLDLVRVDPDSLVSPAELYGAIRTAQTRTHRKGWRFTSSNWQLDENLNVGSRKSARYGRFYTREQNRGVRHELELKDELATQVALELAAGASVDALYAREHEALVSWPTLPGWVAWRATWTA